VPLTSDTRSAQRCLHDDPPVFPARIILARHTSSTISGTAAFNNRVLSKMPIDTCRFFKKLLPRLPTPGSIFASTIVAVPRLTPTFGTDRTCLQTHGSEDLVGMRPDLHVTCFFRRLEFLRICEFHSRPASPPHDTDCTPRSHAPFFLGTIVAK